jgi:hypothetical protein
MYNYSMDALIKKVNTGVFNSKPVVVMPISVWDKIHERIEEMQENLEMYMSENYKKNIARSRASKKIYTSKEVRKKLAL